MNLYILDEEKNPVRCDDSRKWERWMGNSENRVVERTNVSGKGYVSTVFLGFEHSLPYLEKNKNYIPFLFETMVFSGKFNRYSKKHSSYEEAKIGHAETVKMVLESDTK